MIDPKSVDAAKQVLEGAGKLGCNIDSAAVVVARALLAEHRRQERERCGTCRFTRTFCNLVTKPDGFCHQWMAKDGEELEAIEKDAGG
jgi:hypothetical protein